MFARLFAITSTLVCCAAMPVAAMLRARIYSLLALDRGELVDRLAHEFGMGLAEVHGGLVGPHDLDHVRDFDDGLDVRAFDGALLHGGGRRLRPLRRRIEAAALARERAVVGEVDDVELADDAVLAADGSVRGDGDVAVIRRYRNVAALALHGIAGVGDEAARRIEREMAVARIAGAVGRLDDEITLTVQRHIERRAR